MLISEKSIMVTYPFLSCYVNEIPSSSSHIKIREILRTDYTECTKGPVPLERIAICECKAFTNLPNRSLFVSIRPIIV